MDSPMLFGFLGFISAFIIAMAPIARIKAWSPFKIDALGIVTLLGADEIRKVLGRLVYSPYEYFPLLAGHIFADNSIANPISGFVCYNATEGMMATDLSAWFTRWLLCQNTIGYSNTTLDIRVVESVSSEERLVNTVLAVLLNLFLVVWPILLGDWYGFTTSLSLVLTVIVRVYVLSDLRASLDILTTFATASTKMKDVKLFITFPDDRRISVTTTTGITQDCLLTEARPRKYHMAARTIGWLAFGIHAVSLGMACLAMQLILITITLACSVAAIQGWYADGWDKNETLIGNCLLIKHRNYDGYQKMGKTYALQNYTAIEEQNMVDWALFPKRTNNTWWSAYRKFKEESRNDPAVLETWSDRLQAAHEAE